MNNLTVRQWAKRINSEWHQLRHTAVKGFFELGGSLIQAKEELGHGGFMEMVAADLDISHDTVNAFMRIAAWQIPNNVRNLLPPDWGTIRKLTRLEEGLFGQLVDRGVIRPELKRNEVSKLLRLQTVGEDERRVLNLVPTVGKFRTLVIDPAWEYDWLSIAGRAKPGYAMQSLDQLRELNLRQWVNEAEGCHLYCWTTNNFSYEAHKLVDHWGFQHRTILTWLKPPPFGLGSYYRNSTEQVLFATLGNTTTRPAAASIPTHFEAPRGEHSEKPEKFYDIVRAGSYPPFGEANQRALRPDFVNLFDEVAEAAE